MASSPDALGVQKNTFVLWLDEDLVRAHGLKVLRDEAQAPGLTSYPRSRQLMDWEIIAFSVALHTYPPRMRSVWASWVACQAAWLGPLPAPGELDSGAHGSAAMQTQIPRGSEDM